MVGLITLLGRLLHKDVQLDLPISSPQGMAIVISQDGAVSFVANRAGEVVIWEQSVRP